MKTLEDELRSRTWPAHMDAEAIELGDYHLSAAVAYGRVETRALRLHQSLSEPIPPGECAITSLCLARGTRIAGATSGRRSHVFCYDPGSQNDGVIDLGVLEGARAVRRSLIALPDGRVFGGVTEFESPADGGYLFQADFSACLSNEFHAASKPPQRLLTPKPGEGIAALAIDPGRGALYGLTTQTGSFFAYQIETGVLAFKGPVSEDGHFSSLLTVDGEGNVFGAGACGALFRYDPRRDRLEKLDRRIPSIPGRQFYNRWDASALDPHTGLIYGAGSADGLLFELDPRTLAMKSLGKVMAEPRVRGMTMGLDGRVYGVAGNEGGMAHLFYYDVETHELRDLGILWSAQEHHTPGYEFDAACTGRWGEIYFGESEWESHLFIYQPPIRPESVVRAPRHALAPCAR